MQFYVIYVRERHPLEEYAGQFSHVRQHESMEERRKVAGEFVETIGLTLPLLVDEMDNKVVVSYRGDPDRLYVIDETGKIVYKGGQGPFGFRPSIEVAPYVLYKLTDKK